MLTGGVAALFVCRSSPYWSIPGVVCFDEERDPRTYRGACPVIAHPPRRGWGQLRSMSNHEPAELDLARFAVSRVRTWGGVLEHPARSGLWAAEGLPLPGRSDGWGFTLGIEQADFGHRARKPTWLYICGAGGFRPQMPLVMGERPSRLEWMGRAERERTPPLLALWLVAVARRCARLVAPELREVGRLPC